MSRCPAAVAAWLTQHFRQASSIVRPSSSLHSRGVSGSSRAGVSSHNVHSHARHSPANHSAYRTVSSLVPLTAYNTLTTRLGQQQTHRELSWMIESITRTPLATLRSHQSASLSALIRSLPPAHLSTLHSLVQQRASGVPLQYLLGDVQWCAVNLLCRPPTLIPRPETEEIVDWMCAIIRAGPGRYTRASEWPATSPSFHDSITAQPPLVDGAASLSSFRVLDVCTGSGCISLALAAHLACTTLGTDIANTALQLAADNKTHIERQLPNNRTLHSTFQYDDVCNSQLPSHSFHLVIANPPYIPTADIATLQAEVQHHESTLALDGGITGTLLYPHITTLAARVLQPLTHTVPAAGSEGRVGWPELVVEIGGDEQRESVMESCRLAGFVDCAAFVDRAGRTRWIAGKRQ